MARLQLRSAIPSYNSTASYTPYLEYSYSANYSTGKYTVTCRAILISSGSVRTSYFLTNGLSSILNAGSSSGGTQYASLTGGQNHPGNYDSSYWNLTVSPREGQVTPSGVFGTTSSFTVDMSTSDQTVYFSGQTKNTSSGPSNLLPVVGTYYYDNISFTLPAVGGAPTISNTSGTAGTNSHTTKATVTANDSSTISSVVTKYGTSSSSLTSTATVSSSGSVYTSSYSGLTGGTTYYFTTTATDSYGRTASYSGTFVGVAKAPVISNFTATPAANSAVLNYTVNWDTSSALTTTGAIDVYYWKDGSSTVSSVNGSSVTSTTISNLTPNTLYKAYITATNKQSQVGTSSTISFTSKAGTPPTIGTPTVSVTRTSGTITPTVTFHDGSSFSSGTLYYGTSTSTMTSTSSFSSVSAKTISSLSANTTYYYKLTFTDNYGRSSTSSNYSFTTSGNNPVINSVGIGEKQTTCTLTPSVTYDTNASASSWSVKYGTSTSYGSTSSSLSLSGLQTFTTYYFSITVTDNFGRTSTAYTGSFTTHYPTEEIVYINITNTTTDTIDFEIGVTNPDRLNYINYNVYSVDTGLKVAGETVYTGLANNNPFFVDRLSPDKSYRIEGQLSTKGDYLSTIKSTIGHTDGYNFVHKIDADGTDTRYPFYYISPKLIDIKTFSWDDNQYSGNEGDTLIIGTEYGAHCNDYIKIGKYTKMTVSSPTGGIYKVHQVRNGIVQANGQLLPAGETELSFSNRTSQITFSYLDGTSISDENAMTITLIEPRLIAKEKVSLIS